MADLAAKQAALTNEPSLNKVDYKQALAKLNTAYENIDNEFLEFININTGENYMNYLSDIDYNFLKKKNYKFKRRDLCILNRTGYAFTQSFFFK